jgi:hypothetical protein
VSPYKRQFTQTSADGLPESFSDKDTLRKIAALDHGLEHTSCSLVDLYSEYSEHTKDSSVAVRSLEHKLEKVTKELGLRPQALSGDYDAPTAWGSIGALGQKLDQVAKGVNPGKAAFDLTQAVEGVKLLLPGIANAHTATLNDRVTKIKDFSLRSAKKLNDRISVESDAWMFSSNPAPAPAAKPSTGTPAWASFVTTFESCLDDASARLSKVTAETDKQAIRFAGLGFRSTKEANAHLGSQFGYLVRAW